MEIADTEVISFKTFFEKTPPNTPVTVGDFALDVTGATTISIRPPIIDLHCTSDKCQSELRVFHPTSSPIYGPTVTFRNEFVTYTCRNCTSMEVVFAFAFRLVPSTSNNGRQGVCQKFGQIPPFGEPTSPKLMSLIQPDRDMFIQGRQAENRGFGIGAFAYYRRVVENQKNRIIESVAKVARLNGSNEDIDSRFKAALAERQFGTSLSLVQDVLPQSLMIAGQNPLKLLHSALSKGLHDPEMTDAHCLDRARAIRTVLGELADRAAQALKDDKAILDALKVLRQ